MKKHFINILLIILPLIGLILLTKTGTIYLPLRFSEKTIIYLNKQLHPRRCHSQNMK